MATSSTTITSSTSQNDRTASDTTAPPSDAEWLDLVVAGTTGTGEANVQSDWNVTDSANDAFIRNKPTVGSLTSVAGTAPINVDTTTPSTPNVSLNDAGVTTAKLADNAVTEPKIGDNQITTSKLVAGSVIGDKIRTGTIKASHLQRGSLTAPRGGQLIAYNQVGNNFDFVDSASNYKGAWASGTSYVPGDVVVSNHYRFISKTTHTAASSNAPFAGANWRLTWGLLDAPDPGALVLNAVPTLDTIVATFLNSSSHEPRIASIRQILDLAQGEANVQADWNVADVNSDAFIKNKPTSLGGSGTGDITAVTAGTGLSGGGTSGDVTLNIEFPLPSPTGKGGKFVAADSNGTAYELKDAPSGSGGGLSFKGAWADATAYVVFDIVTRHRDLYMCVRAHTSNTGRRPYDSFGSVSYWRTLSYPQPLDSRNIMSTPATDDILIITDVSNDSRYAERITVANLLSIHEVKTDNTLTGKGQAANILKVANPVPSPSGNANKYLGVNSAATAYEFKDAPSGGGGGSSNFKGAWSIGTAYVHGDIVEWTNRYFICETAHTSSSTVAPMTGATWRTNWRLLSEPDVAQLPNTLTATQIVDTDTIAVADQSQTNKEPKAVTVAALFESQDVKPTVCLTQSAYDTLNTKDSNTIYMITGA